MTNQNFNPKDDPKYKIMVAVKAKIQDKQRYLPFVAQRISINIVPDRWNEINKLPEFQTLIDNYANQVRSIIDTWEDAGFEESVIQWSLLNLNIELK